MLKAEPKYFNEKLYNPFLHIWGAICFNGKSELKYLKSKEHWNSEMMAKTFEENLKPLQKKLFPDNVFYFVQDNARPHKGGVCKQYLEENYAKNVIEHPTKSPDLNPIEKIWGILKERVYLIDTIQYQNRKDLKKAISQAWNEISLETIRLHITDLFNTRIEKVLESGGELIK